MMQHRRRWQWMLAWAALSVPAMPAAAITIQLDYTYDTSSFFAPGSAARSSLQAAADYFSTILDDTFSAITVPEPYPSSVQGSTGLVTWSWDQGFSNPSSGAFAVVDSGNIASDRYVIYAGARPLSGVTAGVGGPGTFGWERAISGTNSFTQSDLNQIDAIHDSFVDALETRGESSGFAGWGGSISFDTSNRNWHFDLGTTPTSGNVTDFYSVAIHELAHALGFGQDDNDPANVTPWESWISGSSFFGDNAYTSYGGPVPLSTTDLSHWAPGTTSVVYGTSASQETAMDPDLAGGMRKFFTDLDAAAMKDIGWSVIAPPGVDGDYNNNGVVDTADYVVWRKTAGGNPAGYATWWANFGQSVFGGAGSVVAVVPEPAGGALALLGWIAIGMAHRRRYG